MSCRLMPGPSINFRIKPGDTVEDVLAHVKTVVNDRRVKIRLVDPESGKNPSRQSSIDSPGIPDDRADDSPGDARRDRRAVTGRRRHGYAAL